MRSFTRFPQFRTPVLTSFRISLGLEESVASPLSRDIWKKAKAYVRFTRVYENSKCCDRMPKDEVIQLEISSVMFEKEGELLTIRSFIF